MRSYQEEVELLAQNAIDELDKYEYDGISDMTQDCMESTNFAGSTDKAIEILQESQTPPSYYWKGTIDLEQASWRDILQAMAYTIMRQDVRNKLRELLPDDCEGF